MFSKRLLLVFAIVLLFIYEITAAKELASNHESYVEDVKYELYVPQHHKHGLQVVGFINRRLSQLTYDDPYTGGRYPLPPGTPCCGGQAEATHKQAKEAQTHN